MRPPHFGEVSGFRNSRSTKRTTRGGMAWKSRNKWTLAVAEVKGENPYASPPTKAAGHQEMKRRAMT